MAEMEVVFKKVCSYAQPQNLVNVKQLLIVREDGKKYLMLRLVNERSEQVSAVTVSVVQYDETGREMGTKLETLAVSGGTDKPFVPEQKILLSDNVCDCKVLVTAADYGDYRYRADGKNVVVDYKTEKPEEKRAALPQKKIAGVGKDGVAVQRRTLKAPALVVVGMFIALALALFAVVIHTLYFVEHEKTFLYSGIEYAFENDDKSDGTNIFVVGYNGNRARVVIPEYIEGHKVTHIAKGAFRDNDGMTSIGFEAAIPVEDFAFENCKALKTVEFEKISEIGVGAFKGCSSLTEAVIPEHIIEVPRETFSGCKSLETVTVPQSDKLIRIGQNAFAQCTGLREADISRRIDYSYNAGRRDYFTGAAVRKLHIVDFDTTSEISGNNHISSLFGKEHATSTNDIELGELVIDRLAAIPSEFCAKLSISKFEVRSIGDTFVSAGAFYGCSNLKEFKLPAGSSATGVGAYAFYGTALTGFNGITVGTLEDGAFENCTALTSVSFSGNVALTELGDGVFKDCSSLASVSIPVGVTTISRQAFMNCEALTSVRYANAAIINEIGESAFKNCASLVSITFPGDTLATISASAFEGCASLASIALPDTLLNASDNAFKDCASLTELTVPDSVVRMGNGIIAGCNNLTSITVPFLGEMPEVNNYLAYMFGANNRYFSENAFVPSSLSEVTVTTSNTVGVCAFNLCENISVINLPETVADIGESAFNGCSSLTEFTLPNSVVSVGRGAFTGCSSLSSLTVPFVGGGRDSNAFLSYMFGSASYSDSSAVPQSLMTVIVTDAERLYVGAFDGCEYLQNVTLPETLSVVDSGAFRGCAAIEELVIPNSVQNIGGEAFSGMVALKKLTVPFVGVSRADAYTYTYADEQFSLGFWFESREAPRSLKKLVITDCAYIGFRAFYNCLFLEQVELDREIAGVGAGAFERCFKLYEVFNYGGTQIARGSKTDAGGIARYALKVHTDPEEDALPQAEADGFRYVRDDDNNWYLIDCDTSVEQITLPTSVSAGEYGFAEYALWQYIFYGCDRLKSAEIPANVTAVGDGVFGNCTALTRVNYASGSRVTAVGDETFYNCYMLYDLNLPEGLTGYGARSFYNCSRIKRVVVPVGAEASSIGEQAFYNCSRLFEVINLSGLDIYAGDTRFGYIAANARLVSSSLLSSLDSVISAGVHYMALNDGGIRYWAVDYYGTDGNLSLTPFMTQRQNITEFAIYPRAFNSYDCMTNMTVGYDSIVNVTISNAIGNVHTEFYGCENIRSVSFVDCGTGTAVTLGENAFMSARGSLTTVSSAVPLLFNGADIFPTDRLTSARFDAHIPSLSPNVFAPAEYYYEPVRLEISLSSVGIIHGNAFGGTTSLYSVAATGAVDTIMSVAFGGCSNLNSVRFGNVGSISDQAFAGNANLASASFGNVTSFGSYIFGTTDSLYDNVTLATLTAGEVGNIGEYAFYNLQGLSSVSFAQVDRIGDRAFAFDYRLVNFNISSHSNTLDIGGYAFASTGLTSFTYAGRIGTLGAHAFDNCSDLRTVNLGTVYSVGSGNYSSVGYVFSDCALDSVTFSGNVTSVVHSAFTNCSIETLTFGGGVGTVGEYAFVGVGGSYVENVVFNANVVSVADYAFYNWEGYSVTFGGSLTALGAQAFAYCFNLSEIVLPEGLAEIKSRAFAGCSSLHKVTLPSSLRTLSDTAFSDCRYVFIVYDRSNYLSTSTVAAKFDRAILVTNDVGKTNLAYYDDNNTGVKFVKVDGRWYVYGMPNSAYNISMLPDSFTVNGENVTSYSIRAYANDIYSSDGNNWYIPTAVTAIDANAFSGNVTVYYRGTQTQWNNIYGGGSARVTLYCYKACVHEDDVGRWRFDANDRPTLGCTEWEFSGDDYQVTTPPACIVEGVTTARCPHCNRDFNRYIGYAPHNIVSGECTVCHAREVALTSENMDSLDFCRIANDTSYPFVVNDDGSVTSANSAAYSTAAFTITATKRVTVSLAAVVESQSGGDNFEILLNGNVCFQLCGYNVSNNYTFNLDVGDVLVFRFSKDGRNGNGGQEIVTIGNLTFICSEDTQNNA